MTYRFAPVLADAVAALPVYDLADLPGTREAMAKAVAAVPVDVTGLSVEELVVPGSAVRVRIVRPAARADTAPGLFHVHGGGFVIGGLDNSHARLCRLVRELGAVAVSVDYRLAPEHRYPAALEDVVTALRWFGEHAAELGVDADRLAVHGISAGAGLAAAATLYVRDHGGPPLCFQYLSIPELDDRQQTPSMLRFHDSPVWDNEKAEISWSAYLGPGVPGSADVEPYAAPARATDLTGLPPAYVSVMEFDPLRDEGIAYAHALLAAGVPVELHLFPGTFHGSASVTDAPITQREFAEETAVLRAAFG